jgi:putative nucleotidyltransferase with HDIG domain
MRETKKQAPQVQPEYNLATQAEIIQGRDGLLSVMTRANEISCATDVSSLTQGMLDLMIEICQAETANFFQLDAATDEFVITHVRGDVDSQYLIGLRLNRQAGLPGIVLCDSRIVVGDLPSEPDWLNSINSISSIRKHNVINLPITCQERKLGVVQLYNFHQAELDLLLLLGDRLALEMDHRARVESTLQSNQRLMTLVEILGEVSGTVDRKQLLHLVTECASRLVGAERSSIFLVDPKTREMVYQVAYQAQQPGFPAEPGAAQTKKRQARGQPGHKNHRESFETSEFSYFNRSAITVPIQIEPPNAEPGDETGHILGGLMVLNKQNASFQEEDARLMNILANQASTSLQLAEMYESSGELFLGVIKALATAIDTKDPYTQGHSERVSDYAVMIARELGLDETSINDLRIGSLFHDIGKIGIPDAILLKPGKLDELEMETIRQHPRTGVNILSQVKLLEPMTPAILEHHERLDGSGYPAGLTDKQISWMGRIVAVADVFDAMTSTRPYRKSIAQWEVIAYLREHAGILFDAECVEALAQAIDRDSSGAAGL